MSNGATYFKWSVILISIFCLVAVLYMFRGCVRGDGGSETKPDTISVIKTITVTKTDTQIVYVPKVKKETVIKDSIIYLERQPEYRDLPEIVKGWITQYHTARSYDTTITLSDSLGELAKVIIKDSVYKNRIVWRKIDLSANTRTITNTITVDKQRTKGYIGLNLLGTKQPQIQYVGVDFSLLFKTGNMIGIEAGLLRGGNTLYGFNYKRLISLRKRER